MSNARFMKSKWETHIRPYMAEIENWTQQGMPQRDIAGKLGVSYTTFRKYVKKDEKLQRLLKSGKQRAKRKVDRALAAKEPRPRPKARPEPTEVPVRQGRVGRPDQSGVHRKQFEKNKKKIYATQDTCAICGKPVDFSLKYPHPLSPCIDHIIPVSKGGHPSDINNLQLAHWTCNRQKSDKLTGESRQVDRAQEVISNRVLPHTFDWRHLEDETQKK